MECLIGLVLLNLKPDLKYFVFELLSLIFSEQKKLTLGTCRGLLLGTPNELLSKGLSQVEWHML